VRAFGEVFRDVGVHLKGTVSYRPINDKPSFTLDFGKFVRGQGLRGLQQIHLNNAVQDSTCLKEQIAGELFRAAHVPVPRVAHALVTLNGRELGLYVIKEGFTQEFLSRHFERADGNLYDTDDGHDVDQHMKRHLGQASTRDQIDLQHLAAAAMEPDLSRRWERLQQTLDMDRFFTFMAMELMICHWDGYCLGRNNFRIYHDPGTRKMVFLPSGMDQVFSKADLPGKPDPPFPDFDHDVALLAGWKAFDEPVGGKMHDGQSTEGNAVLQIVAGAKTSASWRTTVKLKQGRYRFQGRARVADVTPLPFGNHHGASLRVAGKPQRSAELVNTSDWEELKTE